MNNKSNIYMKAGIYLLNNRFYAPSIHCFYYSVLQYMKYLLANLKENPISYEEQSSHREENSHNYIIHEVINRINLKDYRKVKKIQEDIKILKKYRVNADYTQTSFSEEECVNIREKAETLKSMLKNYYNNKLEL